LPGETVRYLAVDEVLEIHRRLIEVFGGPAGVRDRGLLDSALYRPRTGYYADLVAMAAALFESLLMNHCFVDGNERVAVFATDVFLRMNGWKLAVEPAPAHEFLVGLLERRVVTFDALETWIRSVIRPV
jgi:death-on-curing protein